MPDDVPPAPALSLGQMVLLEAKARGHSQAEAAKAIGAHQQQVSRWVAGTGHPTWAHAEGLAAYLRRELPDVLLLLHAAHTGRAAQPPFQGRDQLLEAVNHLMERVNLLEHRLSGLGGVPD